MKNDYKIAVDSSEMYEDHILCFCYTPGMPHAIDPGVEKKVTVEEIRDLVGDPVYIGNSEGDGKEYPFSVWYQSLGTLQLEDICADIINKRENRTVVYVHGEPMELQSTEPFDRTLFITEHIKKVA